jgi:hypothetical protein
MKGNEVRLHRLAMPLMELVLVLQHITQSASW